MDENTIIDLFNEQVVKTPNKIALVVEGKCLTYKFLDDNSNQLANYLLENCEIQLEDLVGIKLNRDEWMIISLLGILKSGAAYVPIDLHYPKQRQDFIEKDTKCKIIINQEFLEKFNLVSSSYSDHKPANVLVSSRNLAYVIYTSGSTGKPKGVMIEHRSVVSFLSRIDVQLGFKDLDIVAATTNVTFDISVLEIFGTLCLGKKMILISEDKLFDSDLFVEEIIKNKVEVLQLTPSRLQQISNTLFKSPLLHLQKLLVGGEAFPKEMYNLLSRNINLETINVYGPTETTIWSSFLDIKSTKRLSIGKPFENEYIYILNDKLLPQPIGVAGELHIGGAGLARGYLNLPELTMDKFIKNPFIKGDRLYKTGDLGRWLTDGRIEYMGRKDHQLKVRGYRIEVGEIESVLLRVPEITDAVVLPYIKDGLVTELIAYFVSNKEYDIKTLRTHLGQDLPDYMIPGHYVRMDIMPLMINGKIDKRSLPDPTDLGVNSGVEYEAPRNDIEERLVKIWQETLGRDRIGVNYDFFEIGGHSLNATSMLNKIRKEFDVEISFSQFFANSKISLISEYINKKSNEKIREVPLFQKPTVTEYENFSDQEYFDVFHQQEKEYMRRRILDVNNSYNMSFYVLFEKLDTYILEKVIQTIFERHESLRTSFKMKENILKQHITKNFSKIPIEYIDVAGEKNKDELIMAIRQNASNTEFDLEKAPLAYLQVVKYSEELSGLLFTLNHTISDDVSMRNLKNEIQTLYDAYLKGKDSPLAPIKFQYKDYAMWVNTFLKSEKWSASKKNYLSKILQSIERTKKENAQGKCISSRIQTKEVCSYRKNLTDELLQNLSDGKSIKQFEDAYGTIVNLVADKGAVYKMIIKEPLFSKLKDMASLNGSSLFVNIIAMLSLAFYKSKDVKDSRIYIPFSTRVFEEFEPIVGWLTSEIILPISVNESLLFRNFAEQVAKEVFENSDYRFYSYEKILNDTDAPLHLLAPVSFNFVVHNETDLTNFDEGHRQNGSGHSDFKLEATQYKNALNFNVEYNLKAYQASDIENIMNIYVGIIEILTENSNLFVSEIMGDKSISLDVLAN
ncbi:MAG: amino acid adenylation domain-containing protein [Flavobacterium nitrogenifigens]|uniref:amino acid adenylation domain-containing protein n=1 Tax=Flavobacterium nitrogenifigens TaxID=1617283 RepID=UPI002809CA45|nr:amino acid adenylation domain-containing protein [Flavobacterium nitrogenifigens]MDQ8014084.1 amino acid adenylation domain-containing protein [Flavobacterium nitrogenifigens]